MISVNSVSCLAYPVTRCPLSAFSGEEREREKGKKETLRRSFKQQRLKTHPKTRGRCRSALAVGSECEMLCLDLERAAFPRLPSCVAQLISASSAPWRSGSITGNRISCGGMHARWAPRRASRSRASRLKADLKNAFQQGI